jgi:hypothetical protein
MEQSLDEKQIDETELMKTIVKTIEEIPDVGVKKILLKKKKKH